MFYCGTCGFSYDDWIGVFYPAGLPRKNWLSYYAQEFNALELNSTYYAIPGPSVIESLVRKTGEGFLFAVKANQQMTHAWQADASVFKIFIAALGPLIRAKKLGCVLAQFPNSFRFNSKNWGYLNRFHDWVQELPLVIEFRNAAWLDPEVLQWMTEKNIGFCCVDEPALTGLMPRVAEITSEIGYIRFHGRNADKWWQHEHAWERYNYTYRREELDEWLPRVKLISSSAKDTFIFANNHWRGQAVDTIRQVRSMLDQLVL